MHFCHLKYIIQTYLASLFKLEFSGHYGKTHPITVTISLI